MLQHHDLNLSMPRVNAFADISMVIEKENLYGDNWSDHVPWDNPLDFDIHLQRCRAVFRNIFKL